MRKFIKWLLGLVAAGSVIGLLYVYFSSKDCELESEDTDSEEEDDFDLDKDLAPVSNREYVPLNQTKASDEASDESAEEPAKEA